MQTRIPIGSLAIALALAFLSANTSTANLKNFGDFPAATVDFNRVTESNFYMDGTTFYYGAPTVDVSTDTLIPTFDDFGVEVSPGPGIAVPIDSTLGMVIVAKPLQSFDTIYFSEHGEYSATGVGDVEVRVTWFVDILEVLDASGNRQPALANLRGETSRKYGAPADGQFDIDFQIGMASELTGITLPDGSTPTEVTKVVFHFDNRLEAFAGNADSTASIEKTDLRISTRPIPEPSSIGLGLLGLIGLVGVVRRRK